MKGIVGTLYMYVVKKLLIVDLLFAVTGTCILQSLHGYLKIEKGIKAIKRHNFLAGFIYNLHWLSVKFWIEFKILLFTFKVLNWMCPDYLKNILSVCNNKRYNLRSSDAILRKPSSFKETCTTVGTCYNNNLQRIRKQKGLYSTCKYVLQQKLYRISRTYIFFSMVDTFERVFLKSGMSLQKSLGSKVENELFFNFSS